MPLPPSKRRQVHFLLRSDFFSSSDDFSDEDLADLRSETHDRLINTSFQPLMQASFKLRSGAHAK